MCILFIKNYDICIVKSISIFSSVSENDSTITTQSPTYSATTEALAVTESLDTADPEEGCNKYAKYKYKHKYKKYVEVVHEISFKLADFMISFLI